MSADLFAAFGDLSQKPQQNRSTPSSTQSPHQFSFGSTLTPSSIISSSHRRTQSSSVLIQSQHEWQKSQHLPAYNSPLVPVARSSLANSRTPDDEDTAGDDGWGDFEVAVPPSITPLPRLIQPSSVTPNSGIAAQPLRTAASFGLQPNKHVRASTVDWSSSNFGVLHTTSAQPSWPPVHFQSALKPPERIEQTNAPNTDPNVIFDADDFEGGLDGVGSDDDFGEFETVSPPAAQPHPEPVSSALPVSPPPYSKTAKASDLLLDLNFSSEPTPTHVQTPKSTSVGGQVAVPKQELSQLASYSKTAEPLNTPVRTKSQTWDNDRLPSTVLPKQPAKLPTKPAASTSDWDWDSVEPPKSNISNKPPIKKTSSPQGKDNAANNDDTSWDWDPVDSKSQPEAVIENSALPPVNVPPPCIILSAFPQLVDQANDYLYKPVGKQPTTIKDRILSDPKVYDFLRGYLSVATVAARIIAGRRLRWHRDKILSQSMSISAAGSKGMKLAGVDKSQSIREDREAADVVSHWKSQVGRLKSTVAAANSANKSSGQQLRIPEINDTIHVQTAKGVPTASKACVICGLKRDERLAKVDYEVEDSFGEWWVEHWGHVACKRFWLQHENTLRQR